MEFKGNKKRFMATLFKGGHFGEDLFRINVEEVIANRKVQKFLESPRSTSELTERFGQYLMRLDFADLLKPLVKALAKDDVIADMLFRKGKATVKNDEGKFRYFALALMFATPDGTLIGEIYSQRALLSLDKKDYKACLKDVTSAMIHDISKKFRKMMTRTRRSAERAVAEQEGKERGTRNSREKIRRREFYDNVLFRPRGSPNKKIPVAGSCVQVKYSNERGRYLVTTDDLPPGSTVIVEDPYISQLQGMFNWDTQRCTFCYKISNNHIPCPHCVFAIYCNEECLVADFRSHKFECPCAPALHGLRFPGMISLSFRAICKAGPKDLYKMFKNKDKTTKPSPGDKCGFDPVTGKYESDSYYPVCNLVNHQDDDDIPALACAAVILVNVLRLYTEYFAIAPLEREHLFMNFVADQIVFHCTSFLVNSFDICDTVFNIGNSGGKPTVSTSSKAAKKRAGAEGICNDATVVAVYPFISLLCHSCAPNCACEHTIGGKMATVTSQFVKAGDELTISYGHWFWSEGRNTRRKELQQRYYFLCDCVACNGKWKIGGPDDGKMEYLCPKCSLRYSPIEHATGRRCVVAYDSSRKPAKCTNCKTVTGLAHFEAKMEAITVMYSTAVRRIDEDTPMEAIPILADCIKSFQFSVAPWRCGTVYEMSAMLEKAHFIIASSVE